MSKQYDAVAKELLALDPAAWAAFVGVVCSPDRVKLVDSDLSAVTAAADKVLRIEDDPPWIVDVEFQSWRDPGLPRQLLKYNALLQDRHGDSVASVLVVLRESGDSPAYSGRFSVTPPLGPAWEFRYTVVRVWETPAEQFLTGPLILTPLAPVGDLTGSTAVEVLRRTRPTRCGTRSGDIQCSITRGRG